VQPVGAGSSETAQLGGQNELRTALGHGAAIQPLQHQTDNRQCYDFGDVRVATLTLLTFTPLPDNRLAASLLPNFRANPSLCEALRQS
jgi:hypothetical protein